MIPDDFDERLSWRLSSLSIHVSGAQISQFGGYFRLLARWNEKINLTSLPLDGWNEHAIDRLLVEPALAAADVPSDSLRWFDLGSGGGSPAIPLKILRPAARLTMVEARERKAAFLREAIHSIGLKDADVEAARFEEFARRPGIAGSAQLLTARAVRPDREFFETAATFLASSGQISVFSSAEASLELPPGLLLVGKTPLLGSSAVFHVKQTG